MDISIVTISYQAVQICNEIINRLAWFLLLTVKLSSLNNNVPSLNKVGIKLFLYSFIAFQGFWEIKWLQNVICFVSNWVNQCVYLTFFWFLSNSRNISKSLKMAEPIRPLCRCAKVKCFYGRNLIGSCDIPLLTPCDTLVVDIWLILMTSVITTLVK